MMLFPADQTRIYNNNHEQSKNWVLNKNKLKLNADGVPSGYEFEALESWYRPTLTVPVSSKSVYSRSSSNVTYLFGYLQNFCFNTIEYLQITKNSLFWSLIK